MYTYPCASAVPAFAASTTERAAAERLRGGFFADSAPVFFFVPLSAAVEAAFDALFFPVASAAADFPDAERGAFAALPVEEPEDFVPRGGFGDAAAIDAVPDAFVPAAFRGDFAFGVAAAAADALRLRGFVAVFFRVPEVFRPAAAEAARPPLFPEPVASLAGVLFLAGDDRPEAEPVAADVRREVVVFFDVAAAARAEVFFFRTVPALFFREEAAPLPVAALRDAVLFRGFGFDFDREASPAEARDDVFFLVATSPEPPG